MYLDYCDSYASLHPHSLESDKGGAPSPRMPVNSRQRSLECKAWACKDGCVFLVIFAACKAPPPIITRQNKTTDRKLVQ